MLTIPYNYTCFSSRPSQKFSIHIKPNTNIFFPPFHFSKRRQKTHFTKNPVKNSSNAQINPRTLFPGGFKRPEIKIPNIVLKLSSEEVLRKDNLFEGLVNDAVAQGVGIVVLESSEGDESGGRLYDAACVLKSLVEDRAYLLIKDRVDIASAIGASGVLLSDQGLPPIVARNMMMSSKSDSVYLPLVARSIQTINPAINATNADGADLLIVSNTRESGLSIIGNSFKQYLKVPIFFSIIDSHGEDSINLVAKLLESGAPGIVMSLENLKRFDGETIKKIFTIAHDINISPGKPETESVTDMLIEKNGIAGFVKLAEKEVRLIERERELLKEAVDVIQEATPMMKEVGLLEDAASRLTEPFMLVIVGEFNSGKSTVINALLGRKYLKEGVIPTTNEITLLSYSEKDLDEQERCQRNPDGQFICYLSAPILKNMNLVDTPGTNVILQRQQRLTEEFVPRADLILFILSSDRPLTESEVVFLQYLQQWKKKVVFVLNKMDIYRNTNEVEEAISFIKENTQKLLNVEDTTLFPLSARSALEAKLSALNHNDRNYNEIIFDDPRWKTSRFYELEKYLYSFLDGSTDTGMERVRLKLETPISIADRLLNSCARLVKQEYENACQDLIAMKNIVSSVDVCTLKMESQSISWKKQIVLVIESARSRAIKLVESTLKLSNIDLVATYAFKGEGPGFLPITSTVLNDIINPALADENRLLRDYCSWLSSNNLSEGKLFIERFDKQWHQLIDEKDKTHSENLGYVDKEEEFCLKALDNFSSNAAARLFEQEIREIVLGTFGGLGAAGLSASLLTSVLPTTLEDLLALSFCSAGGLLAISKFPGRRKEAIEKVTKVANGLGREIEEAMQKDLVQATERLKSFVETISKPYQDAAQNQIDRLLKMQDKLENVEQKLQILKIEIQNLHSS